MKKLNYLRYLWRNNKYRGKNMRKKPCCYHLRLRRHVPSFSDATTASLPTSSPAFLRSSYTRTLRRRSAAPGRSSAPADVASPRPRKVGGACRIQVLAIARTKETVGGPNEAARSEFRRDRLPVGAKSPSMHYILT